MRWLQFKCSGHLQMVRSSRIVLDGVMNVCGAAGAKHLLDTNTDFIVRNPLFVLDCNCPQKSASQQHVRDLISIGCGHRWGRRDSCIDSEIHVLYLGSGFKLVREAARSGPYQKVGGCSRLGRFHENFVVLALDLEIRAAGGRHRDRLVEFEYGQVVQGSRYTRDILARGLWILGSQWQAAHTINKDKNDWLHGFLFGPERNLKPDSAQSGCSLTSPRAHHSHPHRAGPWEIPGPHPSLLLRRFQPFGVVLMSRSEPVRACLRGGCSHP